MRNSDYFSWINYISEYLNTTKRTSMEIFQWDILEVKNIVTVFQNTDFFNDKKIIILLKAFLNDSKLSRSNNFLISGLTINYVI